MGAAGGGEKWSRCGYAFQTRIKKSPVCCGVWLIGIEDGSKQPEGSRLEGWGKGMEELSFGRTKLEVSNRRSGGEVV